MFSMDQQIEYILQFGRLMVYIQLTFPIWFEIKPIFGNFPHISHHIHLKLIKFHVLNKSFHLFICLSNSPTRPLVYM